MRRENGYFKTRFLLMRRRSANGKRVYLNKVGARAEYTPLKSSARKFETEAQARANITRNEIVIAYHGE